MGGTLQRKVNLVCVYVCGCVSYLNVWKCNGQGYCRTSDNCRNATINGSNNLPSNTVNPNQAWVTLTPWRVLRELE